MKKIKVNDNVLITTGKDKGKKGKVQQVLPKKGKLLIEGLNIYKKHMKAQSETQQAGIIDKEMFVDISNVALIDPNNNEPTKVGISELKDKSKVRINKKTGEVIVWQKLMKQLKFHDYFNYIDKVLLLNLLKI